MVIKIIRGLLEGQDYKVLHIEYSGDGNLYLLEDLKKKGHIYAYHDANRKLYLIPLRINCVFKKSKVMVSTGRFMLRYTIRGVKRIYERAP